jgi:hypothetical protein
VCKPKNLGGLGMTNIKLMNVALLTKWIWKLDQNEHGLCADLLHAKYCLDGDSFAAPTRKGPQVWSNIQKIKHMFNLGAVYRVNNGNLTCFWTDTWIDRGPLCEKYPGLFDIF